MKRSRTAAADDLQPGAAAEGWVELDVGRGFRRPFFAAGGGAPFGADAAVAPWPPLIWSGPPPPMRRSSPAPPSIAFGALVADQGVAEGGAFEVLEAEELVVAVAAGFVRRGAIPRPRTPLPPATVGGEGGDVALAGPAGHPVVAVVAVDEVGGAGAAVDDVDAEVAGGFVVVARAAEHLVVAEVADRLVVVAGAAVDGVVAAPAVDQVGPRRPAEQIVAEAAVDRVVALAAPDHVAVGRPVEDVVAVGARRSSPAAHDIAAGPRSFVGRAGVHREDDSKQRKRQRDPPDSSGHEGRDPIRPSGLFEVDHHVLDLGVVLERRTSRGPCRSRTP